ncbi:MAG: hypothetical protein ACQEP7_04195 [bacterium]
MEKEEFFEEYENFPEEIVEEAWKQADSAAGAQELLQPSHLVMQGKISGSPRDPVGLFQINWEMKNLEQANVLGVAVSPAVEGIAIEENPHPFRENLVELRNSNLRLDRLTDELDKLLKSELKNTSEQLMESLREIDREEIVDQVRETVLAKPDFEPFEVDINLQKLLNIQTQKQEDIEEEEGEEVEFRCGTEVSPTKGVSLDRLSPGDVIFVEVLDSPQSPLENRILSVLENSRDEESGMIPAKIMSIGDKGEGTIRIRVKFGENVTGVLDCGSNINVLCPESTREKKTPGSGETSNFDPQEFFSDYGILLLFVFTGILLILLFALFLA